MEQKRVFAPNATPGFWRGFWDWRNGKCPAPSRIRLVDDTLKHKVAA
jgi:hypothetical protein